MSVRWVVLVRIGGEDVEAGPARASLSEAQAAEAQARALASRERWGELGVLLGVAVAPDDVGPVRVAER